MRFLVVLALVFFQACAAIPLTNQSTQAQSASPEGAQFSSDDEVEDLSELIAAVQNNCPINQSKDAFLSSGWRIGPDGRTMLTMPNITEQRVFVISANNLLPSQQHSFLIGVDALQLITPFKDPSSVVIEGGYIEVRRQSGAGCLDGKWSVPGDETLFEKRSWSVRDSNGPQLIAQLKEETTFVIGLNLPSYCTGGEFAFFVDGKRVAYRDGKPATFVPGNGFLGSGKSVSVVRLAGGCTDDFSFGGSIKIPKDRFN